MTEIKHCHQCQDTLAQWGEDPLQILCNRCYIIVEKQKEYINLKGKSVCHNCMYWHPGHNAASGQCRNSFSANFRSFTSSSENCSKFLSI